MVRKVVKWVVACIFAPPSCIYQSATETLPVSMAFKMSYHDEQLALLRWRRGFGSDAETRFSRVLEPPDRNREE